MADPALIDSPAAGAPEPDIYASLETTHGLPPGLLRAVETTESRGDPNAVSPTGVRGNMQITGATWRDYADPGEAYSTDPSRQREIAARILKDRIGRNGGDVRKGVAAYGDPNQANYSDLVYKNWQNPQDTVAAPTEQIDAEPDPARLSAFFADATVPQDAKDRVGKAMRAKVGGAPAEPPIEPTATATTTTTTTSEPTPPPSYRDTSVDEAGMRLNEDAGRDPSHWQGRYSAALTKPIADALDDVAAAFTTVNPESTGNPLELSTWKDALDRSLKILHPLGVVGEAAGNLVMEAATDAGASPEVAGALALAASLAGGYATPVSGLKTSPGPLKPFQGTAVARTAAQDAETLATQADASLATARGAADVAAMQADDAARAAQTAETAAAPSPNAKARAEAVLTPGGSTAAEGSIAASQQLEQQLDEIRDPVKGIYNELINKAEAEHRSLDPANYQSISEQIAALKDELGPTLGGASKSVIDTVESAINKGERLSAKMFDEYKQQLDTLFPGRVPHNATPKQRALYDFKWRVRDMQRSMYDDADREWAEAADALYRDEIIGTENPHAIGRLVKLAKKDPTTFVERVLGNGTSDKQAAYAAAIAERVPEIGEAVMARTIDSAIDKTTGNLDPSKLLTTIGKFREGFYDAVATPNQKAFFKALQDEQAAVGSTAQAAKTAAREATTAERAVSTAERESTRLRTASEKATEAATAPNRLAYMTARGLEIGLSEVAGRALGHMPGGGLVGLLIPPHFLAKALADSHTANLLARAIRTSTTSNLVPTLINEIRNRGTSVGFLGDE